MSTPEKMRSMDLGGTQVLYSDATKKQAAISFMILLRNEDMPDHLWQVTRRVVFSSQRNSDDAYWEKTYGMAGFESAATGGDGTTCVYNSNYLDSPVFAHEAGHNLATRFWGSVMPPPHSLYGQAQQKEKPVTPYGANSPAEDFAEACMMYSDHFEQQKLKKNFPEKYDLLRIIFDWGL